MTLESRSGKWFGVWRCLQIGRAPKYFSYSPCTLGSNPPLDQLEVRKYIIDYEDDSPYQVDPYCMRNTPVPPLGEEAIRVSRKLNNDEDDSLYCIQSTFVFFKVQFSPVHMTDIFI